MDVQNLTIIASFFLPLLVDLVIRFLKVESTVAMKVVAGVLALLVALVPEIAVNLPITDFGAFLGILAGRFAVVFTISQVVYTNILKNTELSKKLAGQ